MATHTIYIGLDDSTLVYWDQNGNPARYKHAQHQEWIRWQSKMGQEFTVEFTGGKWPFAGSPTVLTSVNGQIQRRQVTENPPELARYKYKVTVLPSGPSDDPEIIIDPSE